MSSPVFLYRQLSPTGDPLCGNGTGNFLVNLPAVAQAISTTLKLLKGEAWENLALGLPLFQSILGVPNTSNGVGLIIRQQILTVPYVTNVSNVFVNYVTSSRAYTFSCTVQTAFGQIQIQNQSLPGLGVG